MGVPFFFRGVVNRLKKVRSPTPIHTHHDDVRLVQRVRRRFFPRFTQFRHLWKVLLPWERRVVRGSAVFFLVGLVWLFGSIWNRYRVEVPAVGGRYVEGVIGTPELVNPLFASRNDIDLDIARLVYTGLMRSDDKQRLVPDLAASYTVSEDKKTYRFDLRRDVLWHDGTRFTARDVAFTVEIIQNPAVGSPLLVSFQGVEVLVIDEYAVQLTLKEPFAPFLGTLAVGIIPEHIWGDVPPERMRLHKQNLQAVGTGPFKFKKLLKDDTGYIYRYELERNPRYYRQPPYLQEFAFQFFSDFEGPTGVIQAMREQKVDGLSFVPHDLKEKVRRKHVVIHTLQLPQYTALFFNQDRNAALKAKEVREALEMALDKDRILREALSGEGGVIYSPILPGFPGYTADIPQTPYDLEKANTALDAQTTRMTSEEYRAIRTAELIAAVASVTSTASVPIPAGNDVSSTIDALVAERLSGEMNEAQVFYRKDKNGAVLEMTLVTVDTPEYKKAAELIAGFWQDIGIKTVIQRVPPKDLNRLVLRNREYDVLLYGLILGSDPDQYAFWHSSQIDFPGLNLSRYVNRTVDGLLVKARETANSEAAEQYGKLQEAILADRPAVFLYTPTYTYATSDRIFGITTTRVYHPADRLNGVAHWYRKTNSI